MATEAACLLSHSRSQYSVKMGDLSVHRQNTSLVIPIQRIIVHPQFSSAIVVKNDIALLKLQHPVNFTSNIYPVCIPSETFFVNAGTKCWVTGWGKPAPGGKIRCSGGSKAFFLKDTKDNGRDQKGRQTTWHRLVGSLVSFGDPGLVLRSFSAISTNI